MCDLVVGLGAWCDFTPEDGARASPGSVCFEIAEFAALADGRRILLHSGERGFAISGPIRPTAADPLAGMSAAEIESHVLTTVLPDDIDSPEDHPYEWLRDLLNQRDIVVTAESLRSVPYTVEFGARLQALLRAD